jgi:Protein of unknown function (DUF3634)
VDQIFNLLIAAAVIALVYWALQPRYVFLIRIDAGAVRLAKGKATPEFLSEVGDACSRAGVRRGWVGGVARGKRVKLAFSRSIPAACQQQLRNVWVMK